MKIRLLVLILFSWTFPAQAQISTCETGEAEAFLDAGNVRARILNNGGLFWSGSPHVYEVPKGDSINALFAASIWLGGRIDGDLRTAATRYGPREFWPGPLDQAGSPPLDCRPYDKIWEIRTEDILAFKQSGEISDNLRNWPWQLGAPIIDGDGNHDNYNLAGGDLPELFGDQRLWWIMNDRGNEHTSTLTKPIGMEVHASSHAFLHQGFVGNTTFYSYTLINKNLKPYTDAYFGLFVDADLGNFNDDFMGSDSLLHLSYFYNADNDDEGQQGYGVAPPAIGITYLETISVAPDNEDNDRDGDIDEADERLGMFGVSSDWGGGGITGNPARGPDYYKYLQSRWKDGSPFYHGLYGYDWSYASGYDYLPLETTRFFFPGDPVSQGFWSEMNYDNRGTMYYPADRRSAASMGPFTMLSGDTLEVRFAIVWSRGNDHLDSVTELKQDVSNIRESSTSFYAAAQLTGRPIATPGTPNFVLGFDQNFPNPFSQSTTLRYSLPQPMQVRLAVSDMLGREVALLVDAQQEAGIHTAAFDAGNLPAGVYLARIELDFLRFTKRMVLIR